MLVESLYESSFWSHNIVGLVTFFFVQVDVLWKSVVYSVSEVRLIVR